VIVSQLSGHPAACQPHGFVSSSGVMVLFHVALGAVRTMSLGPQCRLKIASGTMEKGEKIIAPPLLPRRIIAFSRGWRNIISAP